MLARAEMGDSADTAENLRLSNGVYDAKPTTPPVRRPHLVSSPSQCSNGGDQVARPVYAEVKGQIVFAGFECIQDNRN